MLKLISITKKKVQNIFFELHFVTSGPLCAIVDESCAKPFPLHLIHQNPTKGHVEFPWKNCWDSPSCDLFFCFVAKIVFSNFPKKMSNFFFNEIDCKNFQNLFSMNSAVKNFRKFLIVNFRLLKKNSKFFTAEFIQKNFRKFFTAEVIEKIFRNVLQLISLKKKFDIFSENSGKKNFCHQKKRGRNPNNFSRKIRHDLSLGFDILLPVISCH